jgi:hypothetical protein
MEGSVEFRETRVEIQIQKESSQCLACKERFKHDERHHSLLKIEGNIFLREDYCEGCWIRGAGSRGEIYSHWQTRYRDPAVASATPKEQFLPLLNLCYEAIAQGEAGAAMAYMCALMLRRQKVFKLVREEKENGRSVLIFSDRHNDTQIRVLDPGLSESQFEDARRRLEEVIGPSKGQADER